MNIAEQSTVYPLDLTVRDYVASVLNPNDIG